jgi:hypothetical protein
VLRELLKNPIISAARVHADSELGVAGTESQISTSAKPQLTKEGFVESLAPVEDRRNIDLVTLDEDAGTNDDELDDSIVSTAKTVSFMVNQYMLKVCIVENF